MLVKLTEGEPSFWPQKNACHEYFAGQKLTFPSFFAFRGRIRKVRLKEVFENKNGKKDKENPLKVFQSSIRVYHRALDKLNLTMVVWV